MDKFRLLFSFILAQQFSVKDEGHSFEYSAHISGREDRRFEREVKEAFYVIHINL